MTSRCDKGRMVLGVMVVAVALVVVSCGGGSARPAGEKDFPSFVYGSALSLESYGAAVRHQDELKRIPCYCGCGEANDHASLKECFIKPDGTYDSHAAGCDVCGKEA